MDLDIVFEDDDVLLVNKPTGLVVHPGIGNLDGTLINGLVNRIQPNVGEEFRPGIVHRIDKDTSGLLVLAKTPSAFICLKSQFRDHSIERRYLGLCWGELESQTIEEPLGRHPTHRVKFAVCLDGKSAVTHVDPLQKGIPAQSGKGGTVSLVECRLETGRTHQIRVHMQHIGNPLLGDPLYGRKGQLPSAWRPLISTLKGQMLHAQTLGFNHPNGQRMSFSSELPSQFNDIQTFARLS